MLRGVSVGGKGRGCRRYPADRDAFDERQELWCCEGAGYVSTPLSGLDRIQPVTVGPCAAIARSWGEASLETSPRRQTKEFGMLDGVGEEPACVARQVTGIDCHRVND